MNGTIVGYDPGGNGSHGIAALLIREGETTGIELDTLDTAECVIRWMEGLNPIIGLGVDTLSCWSTGPGGWRDADLWLRENYPSARNSVVAPNSLYGSMALNGMSVLIASRGRYGGLPITETHPKVLYAALSGAQYDYAAGDESMTQRLAQWLRLPVQVRNEHEWDAAISALAAFKGISGAWERDLLPQEHREDSRLVSPCGPVNYWWPD